MTYELHDSFIKRLEDGAFIPKDEANRDYREYLEWLDEGNEPAQPPADESEPPRVVEMRQARLALLEVGLLDTVEASMKLAPKAAQIEWEFALTINRDYPLVQSMKATLGLTESQLDDLFTLAATL